MYPIIRCPSCNNSLGELHEMFQLLKQDKVSSGSGDIKPSQLEIASVEIDTEDIFEFLQVNNWCCRRVLLTVSTFDEQLFALPNMR